MLKSMTGYGATQFENDELSIAVEIRSLNSKYSDVNLRISHFFLKKEIEIKNLLSQELKRGKVNITVKYFPKAEGVSQIKINEPLVKDYIEKLKQLTTIHDIPSSDILRMAMNLPDAHLAETNDENLERHWKLVLKTIKQAIEQCSTFREREGAKLKEKFATYIQNIQDLQQKAAERDPERMAFIRKKLHKQVQDFTQSEYFDPNRFEQELIYYSEKLDIAEEKVRLKTHLEHFLEMLHAPTSNGKKLNFIAQEIGREINTMGAKANDAVLQRLVVEMKNELEKIKEQILNII